MYLNHVKPFVLKLGSNIDNFDEKYSFKIIYITMSVYCQAIATARMKGEYPERVGQPECQACIFVKVM